MIFFLASTKDQLNGNIFSLSWIKLFKNLLLEKKYDLPFYRFRPRHHSFSPCESPFYPPRTNFTRRFRLKINRKNTFHELSIEPVTILIILFSQFKKPGFMATFFPQLYENKKSHELSIKPITVFNQRGLAVFFCSHLQKLGIMTHCFPQLYLDLYSNYIARIMFKNV